jgi:hypothetical protein
MIMEKQEGSPYQKVLMNVMYQSPPWHANIGSDSHEIPCCL